MSETAKDILDRRLALGELSVSEYEQLLERLSPDQRIISTQSASPASIAHSDPFATWKQSFSPLPNSVEQYFENLRKTDLYILGVSIIAPIIIQFALLIYAKTQTGAVQILKFMALFDGTPVNTQLVLFGLFIIFLCVFFSALVARMIIVLFVPFPFVDAATDAPEPLLRAIDAHNSSFLTLTKVDTLRKAPSGIVLKPSVITPHLNFMLAVVNVALLVIYGSSK